MEEQKKYFTALLVSQKEYYDAIVLDLKTQINDLKKALNRAQDGSDASVSSGKKTKRKIYVHILYFRKWYLIEFTTTSKYRLYKSRRKIQIYFIKNFFFVLYSCKFCSYFISLILVLRV